MRNITNTVLSAVDTATQTGSSVPANQLLSASFQVYFGDADAVGTVKIQASNDFSPAGTQMSFTPSHWVDIPNASAAITSSSAALILIPVMSFQWIRVVYTRTSGGSTTITVQMNALSI